MDADEVIRKTLIEASSLSPLAFCAALRKNLRAAGFKVLPREPSREMWCGLIRHEGYDPHEPADDIFKATVGLGMPGKWRAMWDAAP